MKSNFQIILIVVFISFFLIGVLVFSGVIKLPGQKDKDIKGTVTIWGTFPKSEFLSFIESIEEIDTEKVRIN